MKKKSLEKNGKKKTPMKKLNKKAQKNKKGGCSKNEEDDGPFCRTTR